MPIIARKMLKNSAFLVKKTASTATSATLLSPLLSPLNILYIRDLTPKVTVVTVKIK